MQRYLTEPTDAQPFTPSGLAPYTALPSPAAAYPGPFAPPITPRRNRLSWLSPVAVFAGYITQPLAGSSAVGISVALWAGGIVLAVIALVQISRSAGAETGRGGAIGGLLLAAAPFLLFGLFVLLYRLSCPSGHCPA